MIAYTLEPVVAGDAPRLSEISVAAKRYWQYPEAWIQAWLPELHISEAYILQNSLMKVRVEGETVGFCAVEQADAWYEIAHLWVLPAYIGKGLGKALLAGSIAAFVPDGAPLKVVADPFAEPFYTKQGFVTREKTESSPPGRYLPVMWREPV